MFESWIMDSRYAVRRLVRRPTYALLTILTLALGAGGTAAVFSVVRTILLEPLPIAEEERVGVLWFPYSWSEAEFLYLRPNFPGFKAMAAYRRTVARSKRRVRRCGWSKGWRPPRSCSTCSARRRCSVAPSDPATMPPGPSRSRC